jgi:hypothetical protein
MALKNSLQIDTKWSVMRAAYAGKSARTMIVVPPGGKA